MTVSREMSIIAILALSIFGSGCAKKSMARNTPPIPAPESATPRQPASVPAASAVTPVGIPQAPQSRYPDPATRAKIEELLARIQDAYFDYDRHNLRPDALHALQADSKELGDIVRQYPDFKMRIEGHCDERGSAEYNMALGDRRAVATREYLVAIGITADQIVVTSYGKESQVCNEHNEVCWQKNRRAHIVAMAQ